MKITSKATEQLIKLVPEKKVLRIAVIGAGCSGLSYKLSIEERNNITEQDKLFLYAPVDVVIDPKSWLFLQDVTIDFLDGLNGTGFTYVNSKAKRVCGCGTSFSV